MEGSISVASTEGKGSVFSVIIPNIETSSSAIRKKENYKVSEQIVFEKATILVVDNIATNIEVIEDFAISTNLNISSAESGEIALDVLNHITPDLILLDIRLQGIDGYEVAKKIKSDPEKAHIPIVAFTASVFITDDIEKSSDFDDILLKPAKRSELFIKLAKYLKHTIKPASTQTKKIEKDIFENLPEDLLKKLPVIENTLKETFLPQWESIKDTLVLYKIEAFAIDLKQMAENHEFKVLADYANNIIEDVEIVDLDSLKENLQQFPNIINKISLLIKK